MKKYLIILFIVFGFGASAQEVYLPTHTQYLADNPFVIAPTYAGIGDYIKIRLNGLTQWVDIKDAPDTQSLVADTRLGQRSGVGVLFYNDKNGNTRQQGARLSFAHHLMLNKRNDKFLSFGISYNYNYFRIDIENFDPTIPDPSIVDDRALGNHNFDVGVLYRKDAFYFSFTAANILNKDAKNFSIEEPNRLRQYMFYTGYVYKNPRNKNIEIEPSMHFQLFESDGRSVTDLSIKYRKLLRNDDYFWFGLSYRFLNDQFLKPLNVGPMFGILKSKVYFAYSYQVIANDLINYNSGTHMITVGFDLFQGISNCPCTK
ncbi:type IX secretion system membrane protein PorP/SprF [Geojedonia litorea]|uniref:Type IX secretion system membrane protein PorP/SprF n=1 Tax=Geojedonia litorea TaxID=1268269 RepID=A0ABV9N5S1_9FLAO